MPKAILEFDLPEDDYEHEAAVAAMELVSAVQSLDNWLRNLAKYDNKTTVEIEEVRSKIREETSGRASFIWG